MSEQGTTLFDTENVVQGFKKSIREIEIKNFRNIAHEIIELKDGKSVIITGRNEMGKTNRIEAVLWLLGNTLFDGTSKDSMSNLEPETAPKGTTVSVKVTFSDGQSVEKTYTRPYIEGENGDLIPKNATVNYIVNGGKPLSTVGDGVAFIYEQLGLTELQNRFNKNSVLKTNVNLAYLLLTTRGIRTFDNATMRALITDIVGDVKALDMAIAHKETYGDLIPLLQQSNGDINKVRDDLRFSIQDKTNGLEIQVAKSKGVIENLELEAKKEINDEEITQAKNSIKELNGKITMLEVKKQSAQSGSTDKIDLEISQLENKKSKIISELKEKYQNELNASRDTDLETQVRLKEQSYQTAMNEKRIKETELSGEKLKLSSLEHTLSTKKQEVEKIQERVKELGLQYNEIGKREPSEKVFVTCPHCNEIIDINETKEHQAIRHQHEEAQKRDIKKKRDELKPQFDKLKEEITDLDLRIVKQRANVNTKTNEHSTAITNENTLLQELIELRNTLSSKTVSNTPVLDLNTKEVQTINQEIERLKTSKNEVLSNIQSVIDDYDGEIRSLQNLIAQHELVVDKERVRNANLNALAPKRAEHKKLEDKLTATKELYALSKQLLIETFRELEKRVEVKFGRDVYFKLYEPNASDGGQTYKTSVCEMYVRDSEDRLVPALANGVSTSMQEVRMVEFIERLKKHYNVIDSVILIDRLESLDDIKIEMLKKSSNQLITTAVVKGIDGVRYETL